MKKYLFSFLIIFLFTNSLHADKLLKSGFLSGEWKLNTDFEVKDPKNKILIIYNHGQDDHDKPSKDCVWKNNIRNFASLSGKKVKDKEILVYSFCTDHLGGDDWKRLWKKKFDFPYKGITKLDKRVNEFVSSSFEALKIDEYGNVLGVAVAKLDVVKIVEDYGTLPENVNFGIKASTLMSLLKSHEVPLVKERKNEIKARDLSKNATDGTVFLTCWMTMAQIKSMKTEKVLFSNFK